eukprot:SAG31_NODE_16857_length_690_cov_3.062395_1_plen_86_part_01
MGGWGGGGGGGGGVGLWGALALLVLSECMKSNHCNFTGEAMAAARLLIFRYACCTTNSKKLIDIFHSLISMKSNHCNFTDTVVPTC